jgi:hypothetical protein
MKVYNLCCAQQHVFEGWFASEDDFQTQLARGLVSCPLCGDAQIEKRPAAPRLNLGGHTESAHSKASSEEAGAERVPAPHAWQGEMLRAMRAVLASTEDVGDQFAEQARAMHLGDVEAKPIRGRASRAETLELLDEGVPVLPLPLLPGLEDPLH